MEEIMEEKSVLKTWWSVLGKWQLLAVVITLAVFCIARHITGDNNISAFVAVVFVAFATFAASLTTFAAAFVAVVFAITSGTTFAAALLVAAFIVAAALIITEDLKISKKTVYLSCVAEFAVILLPILGTVQGWW
ncbi:MAG: hypothetical protein V1867_00480 [Candidatus Falkowbacteria bacterium]